MAMAEQQTIVADAQRMMAMLQGFMGTAAVKAALDLEVFTHIAHGLVTPEQLAVAKGTTPRAMRILCDALVAFGALNKSDGRYSLPPGSQALFVKGSPMYMGAMSRILANPVMWEAAGKLGEIVKAGRSTIEHPAEEPDNPFWQEFSRASRQMATMFGPIVADAVAELLPAGGPKRILDIAAGSGMYGFSALKRFPNARLVSVDWPGVLKLAEPTARQMGLSDRVEFCSGDIFSADLGSGYDLVLAVNIYHHFSIEKCTELSRRLYGATAPAGMLIVVDSVPDEKREKDRTALTFALTMLIWTQDGDTYTLSEYRKMLETAGYRDIALKEIPGPRPMQAVIARK
jgi:SAM-dependent methyltransferase